MFAIQAGSRLSPGAIFDPKDPFSKTINENKNISRA